ncbi:MAG: peptidylprolyl isomerase, partial [Deltaproteobacteria bacterium]|nr:peptidylprolyl isomerase [Deltaproteobacteria bacterium]
RMMAPAFDATMMKLKTGEVTAKPVETPFGFHVIKRGALGGTKE